MMSHIIASVAISLPSGFWYPEGSEMWCVTLAMIIGGFGYHAEVITMCKKTEEQSELFLGCVTLATIY